MEGNAYFVSGADVGRMEVSFFGPFYGGYNIIALDKENYSYSPVCGPNRSYLRILAGDKALEEDVLRISHVENLALTNKCRLLL